MRLSRLDLQKYGHFTGVTLDFPEGERDFHLLFGPNEAGKSTTLSAINDLFFGIPKESPFNFLHSYADMRLGAVLREGEKTVTIVRRKGNRETILSPEGLPDPAGEQALSAFLAGVDRDLFGRLFSLDYSALIRGGQEILASNGEAGEILFSAGTGISGLRSRLAALEEQAGELWSARRSSKRKYYQLEERLRETERVLKEHTLSASHWKELSEAVEESRSRLEAIDREISDRAARLRTIERIRRVRTDLLKLQVLLEEICSLGDGPVLPAFAREKVTEAQETLATVRIRREMLSARLLRIRAEQEAISVDEPILLLDAEIAALHARRITVRKEKEDLPRRRGELETALSELISLGSQLGWKETGPDGLLNRIPTREESQEARRLAGKGASLESAWSVARAQWLKSQSELDFLSGRHRLLDPPSDLSGLSAAISAARGLPGLSTGLRSARMEMLEAGKALETQWALLTPGPVDRETLLRFSPPPREVMIRFEKQLSSQETALRELSVAIDGAGREVERLSKDRDRLVKEEEIMTKERVLSLREKRDRILALLLKEKADPRSVSDVERQEATGGSMDLSVALVSAVTDADTAADRRFSQAESEARLRVIDQKQSVEKERFEELLVRKHEREIERAHLLSGWEDLWKDLPVRPHAPETMMEWASRREQLLILMEKEQAARGKIGEYSGEWERLGTLLGSALLRLGEPPEEMAEKAPDYLAELAAKRLEEGVEKANRWQKGEEELVRLKKEVAEKKQAQDEAQREIGEWEVRWNGALSAIGLEPGKSPDAVSGILDVIEQMRVLEDRIAGSRRRIESIERDLSGFESEVKEFCTRNAPDLLNLPADKAMVAVEEQWETARKSREFRKTKERDRETIEAELATLLSEEERLDAVLGEWMARAGVGDLSALWGRIARQERMTAIESEKGSLLTDLLSKGDGLSLEALRTEAAQVSEGEELGEEADRLFRELEEMRGRQKTLLEENSLARRAFEEAGGGHGASEAASDRQMVLCEMRTVAEEYLSLKSAVILLRWAIDRYRKERQGPLLARAGELFRELTGGGYPELLVQYDDHDRPSLVGRRSGGRTVSVGEMSTGTADVLYLALRLASVGDLLDRTPPLPLIVDDLLINLDNDRARSAFSILGEISRRTQVLFLTHHRHLVELGQEVLGAGVSVLDLSGLAGRQVAG